MIKRLAGFLLLASISSTASSQAVLGIPADAQPSPSDPPRADYRGPNETQSYYQPAQGNVDQNGYTQQQPGQAAYPKPFMTGQPNANGEQPMLYIPDQTVPPLEYSRQRRFPLTPEEIQQVRRDYDQIKEARSVPSARPSSEVNQIILDLSPTGAPPVIRVAPGSGGVISFRDLTGAAWPIVSFQNFNISDFEVSQPLRGSNMLSVASLATHANGNVAVVLQDYPTPVIFAMLSTVTKIDARLDVQIPKLGPYAAIETVPVKKASSGDLVDVLYGLLPDGAKQLRVEGARAKAWKTSTGDILLTGNLQVLSPLPIERETTGDGYFAYRLPPTSVFLVMQNGGERKLVLQGELSK